MATNIDYENENGRYDGKLILFDHRVPHLSLVDCRIV